MKASKDPWYGHHDNAVEFGDSLCRDCVHFEKFNSGGFGMVDSVRCQKYGGWVLCQSVCDLFKKEG